jgi:hypothetical protein
MFFYLKEFTADRQTPVGIYTRSYVSVNGEVKISI